MCLSHSSAGRRWRRHGEDRCDGIACERELTARLDVLVNARLQWSAPDAHTVVSLFGNNLLNKTYATCAQRFGGGYRDPGSGAGVAAPLRSAIGAVRGRPREYGVTVQYNFK